MCGPGPDATVERAQQGGSKGCAAERVSHRSDVSSVPLGGSYNEDQGSARSCTGGASHTRTPMYVRCQATLWYADLPAERDAVAGACRLPPSNVNRLESRSRKIWRGIFSRRHERATVQAKGTASIDYVAPGFVCLLLACERAGAELPYTGTWARCTAPSPPFLAKSCI